MKPSGPKHERETIIWFSDEDDSVDIWTASGIVHKRLTRLGFQLVNAGERHSEFKCTLKNLRLHTARKLTTEQRAALSARMTELRSKNPILQGKMSNADDNPVV